MVEPWKRLLVTSVKFVSLTLFMCAWYVASPVFVGHWLNSAAPWAMPALQIVYWPMEEYFENPQLPGGRAYNAYIGWCANAIENQELKLTTSIDLDAPTNSEWIDGSLRDYVDMLSGQFPIALTSQVDVDNRITLSKHASLRERLSEIEEQCGVGWKVIGGQLTIGTPESLQQLAAAHDAEEKAKRVRGRIAMLFSAAAPLVFLTGLVWQFRRRRLCENSSTANR